MARGSANMILLAVLLVQAASPAESRCKSEAAKGAIAEALLKLTYSDAKAIPDWCQPLRSTRGEVSWFQLVQTPDGVFPIDPLIRAFRCSKTWGDFLPVENAWNEEEEAKMNEFSRKMRGNLETVLGKKFPVGTNFKLTYSNDRQFRFRWNNTPNDDPTQQGAGYCAIVMITTSEKYAS